MDGIFYFVEFWNRTCWCGERACRLFNKTTPTTMAASSAMPAKAKVKYTERFSRWTGS